MKNLLCTLCLLLAGCSVLSAEEKRPNILFAFADDWGKYASCYAQVDGENSINSVFQTPAIDAIAAKGTLFKNAFVTAPSCTPCRSSLLSGQYFYRTGRGAILQGAVWDPMIPTYPLLLQKEGYYIGQTYKVWSPGTPRDAPYGGKQQEFESAGVRFNGFSQVVYQIVERQDKTTEQAKQVLLDELRKNVQSFLDDRPDDAPFCYWWGPTNVHRKWIKGSGKHLWGITPDDLKGKLPAFLPDVHEVRQDFADYLGEVRAFDAGLKTVLEVLSKTGELDNTMIVISGDHGAPGFPRGKCNLYDFGTQVPLIVSIPGQSKARVVEDFVNLMDLAPTFLEIGGVVPPQVMTGKSLVPVLESNRNGLVDESRDWVVTGRERHVAAVRDGFLPYPQRAIRTKDYLYIINFKPDRWPMGSPMAVTDKSAPATQQLENNTFIAFGDLDASPTKAWLIEHRHQPQWKQHYQWAFGKRPSEELYVLTDDPDQVHNVAGNLKYAEVKMRLKGQLMSELKSTGDPRVMGDGATFDKPPFTEPFRR
ncbi:MAG: sulfatase [Planctomycetaceae bacterium]|nr:sulfatase [Planctomycetaceae bacterium]